MFARTARLTLRPGWPEDADALHGAIAHEAVAMRLSRLPWPYARKDAAAYLERDRAIDDVAMLILSHESTYPTVVGGIGLHPCEAGHELGYWLTPAAWGRGYATEAGRAMVDIAAHALGLKRIVSGHFVDNPASGRVLAKLGFRPVGHEQRRCLARGEDVACALVELDLEEAQRPLMPIAA